MNSPQDDLALRLPLTGVQLVLDIRDQAGNAVNDLFATRGPTLSSCSKSVIARVFASWLRVMNWNSSRKMMQTPSRRLTRLASCSS